SVCNRTVCLDLHRVLPWSTVFPYTTLFRSYTVGWAVLFLLVLRWWDLMSMPVDYEPAKSEALYILTRGRLAFNFWGLEIMLGMRSEEHTSELQSRENLVCRLLLEKKNQGTG